MSQKIGRERGACVHRSVASARRLPRSRHLPLLRFGGTSKAKLTFQLCAASSVDQHREGRRRDRASLSKAHEALERVASGPAAASESLVLYARTLLQEGDVDGAEHALQQATTRYPIDSQAFLLYATTAERQNHPEAARQALIDYQAIASADATSVTASLVSALSQRLAARSAAIKK